MHRPSLASLFEGDPLWVGRHARDHGRPGACASLLDHGLQRRRRGLQRQRPSQGRLDLAGQRAPLLEGAWRETAKRADGPLPGTLGGMHRLDQEIVSIGFPLGNLGRFSNVHGTLYTLYSYAKARGELVVFVTIEGFQNSSWKTKHLWHLRALMEPKQGFECGSWVSEHIGTRTKEMGLRVYERLKDAGVAEKSAKEWAQKIAAQFGKLKAASKEDSLQDLEIEQLAHFSPEERTTIEGLANTLAQEKRAPTDDALQLLRAKHRAVDI